MANKFYRGENPLSKFELGKSRRNNSNPPESSVPIIGRVGRDERGLFYEYFVRITLEETNIEGTVSHDQFARMFGKARELFALEGIPKFAAQMGRSFFLQTISASYNFKKNFKFGNTVITRVRLLKIGNSSLEIGAEFINAQTQEVHATGSQIIVCTNLNGKPIRIPDELRLILMEALPSAQSK